MITYRATLDVPRELVWFAVKLLLAERRERGTPRGSRAHAHGGNIQAVIAPSGFRLWVSEVEPGSVHEPSRI